MARLSGAPAALLLALIALGAGLQSADAQRMTLMSGQVVDIQELKKAFGGKCCIPRTALGDASPVVRIEGGGVAVTFDPDCSFGISSNFYPSTYEAINVCGSAGASPEGGPQLVMPDDYCVDSNNNADPNFVCSVGAPICDAGYSGKCVQVPDSFRQSVGGASLTLQSGQVVDLFKLREAYGGACCLPRAALNDYTPVVRMDNGAGAAGFFVTNDPSCNSQSAIPYTAYPSSFQYIQTCASPQGGPPAYVDGGSYLIGQGATCDPYYYSSVCWGAAPICSFGGVCVGFSTYGWDNWNDWGAYRPPWWVVLPPLYRPGFRPPIWNGNNRPWGPPWHPPPNWGGSWKPGDNWPGGGIRPPGVKPPIWKPPSGYKPPGGGGSGWKPPTTKPSTKPSGDVGGPGIVLKPGGGGGGGNNNNNKPSGGGNNNWQGGGNNNNNNNNNNGGGNRPNGGGGGGGGNGGGDNRPNGGGGGGGGNNNWQGGGNNNNNGGGNRPNGGGGGGGNSWQGGGGNNWGGGGATTRPSMPSAPTTRPYVPPSMPQTRPSAPQTRPLMPQTRPQMPQTRPSGGGGGFGGGGGRGGGGGGGFGGRG